MHFFSRIAARLLAPATLLMARFGLPAKLLALSTLMFLPLLYLAEHSLSRDWEALQFTRSELRGARQIVPAADAVAAIQGARAALGTRANPAARAEAQDALQKAIGRLEQALKDDADATLASAWRPTATSLAALADSKATWKQHDEAVAALLAYIDLAAETSGLLLDPEAEPYFLMTLTVERLLPWMEALARLREAGNAALADSDQLALQRAVQSALDETEAAMRAVQRRVDSLDRLQAPAGPALKAAIDASRSYAARARAQVFAGSADAAAWDAEGAAAIASVRSLEQELLARLTSLLEARDSAGTRGFWIFLGVTVFALLAINYLMWGFYRGFIGAVRAIRKNVERIANGDLSEPVHIRGEDELAEIGALLEKMADRLSALVANIRNSAAMVAQSGQQLTTGTTDLAVRTEQQAASLEQTSASLTDLAQTVRQSADSVQSVDKLAERARSEAEASSSAMEGAVRTMEEIKNDATRVTEIISLIDGIAFQTNILALNAAVEAARAGEAGRGFAVVAAEVRTLAQRSAAAAREIKALLDQSAERVRSGVEHIDAVHAQMDAIVLSIREVAQNMATISAATTEQSAGILQISEAVKHLDDITQSNGVMVERARVASGELEKRADTLKDAANAFRLRQGVAEEAIAMVEQAMQLVHLHGPQAFAQITADAQERFHDRDMYVFVYDRGGIYRACAGNAARVGQSITSLPGLDARKLLDDSFHPSLEDGSWVDYRLTNPVTGEIAEKTSYLRKIGADMVLGCGVYKVTTA